MAVTRGRLMDGHTRDHTDYAVYMISLFLFVLHVLKIMYCSTVVQWFGTRNPIHLSNSDPFSTCALTLILISGATCSS